MSTTTDTPRDDSKTAPETFALLCKLRDGDDSLLEDMEAMYDHAVGLEQRVAKRTWLIWSMEHKAWWSPGSLGYTKRRGEAGRYTYAEACEIVRNANYAPECREHPNEAMLLDEEDTTS